MFDLNYDEDDDAANDDLLFEIYEYLLVVVNNLMDFHLLYDQKNVYLD